MYFHIWLNGTSIGCMDELNFIAQKAATEHANTIFAEITQSFEVR